MTVKFGKLYICIFGAAFGDPQNHKYYRPCLAFNMSLCTEMQRDMPGARRGGGGFLQYHWW